MLDYVYKAVNPRDDEDIAGYLNLVAELRKFCNQKYDFDENFVNFTRCNMGAIEYIKDINRDQLPPLEDNAGEFAYVCEHKGEFIGFVKICYFHFDNGKCINNDVGILHEIYVKEEYRNGTVAYNLMQMAVEKLIQKGKKYAICNVQDFNPNRFLHFAMADSKIKKIEESTRSDGTKVLDYSLLIDLNKLKNTALIELAKKASLLKKGVLNLEITEDLNQ